MALPSAKLPKKVAQLFQKANQNHVRGDLESARSGYLEVLNSYPKYVECIHLMGVLLCQLKDFSGAIERFNEAIKLSPNPLFYFSRGVAFQESGGYDLAETSYLQALKLRPLYPQANYNLGILKRREKQHDQALTYFSEAAAQKPDYVDAHYNKANTLKQLGEFAQSIKIYDLVISLNKNYAQAYLNKGMSFKELGQFQQALSCYLQALQVNPSYADAHSNMGIMYTEQKLWPDAFRSFQDALAIDPNHAQALWNKSLLLLINQEFQAGFALYPSRWRSEVMISPALCTTKPLYVNHKSPNPDAPTGSVQTNSLVPALLIWAEQGIGDEIMFGSLLLKAQSLAKQLIVQMDARLIPLFKRAMPEITFKPKHEALDESLYDEHMPIGQLAEIFCKSKEDFANLNSNYVFSEVRKVEQLKTKIPQNRKKTIGISWRSKNDQKGLSRSISLHELIASLTGHGTDTFEADKYNIVNLQYGALPEELESVRSFIGTQVLSLNEVDNFLDMDGLAALIECCDLVISIDNSTVHLSGALGKETWVLLPYSCDWRWGLETQKSVWYPSLRLFRQTSFGDWTSVLRSVQLELKNLGD